MEDIKMDEEKYKRARARVEELRKFYAHLFSYIVVNIVLVTTISVYGKRGKKWEEKKIKEIMEKEERK